MIFTKQATASTRPQQTEVRISFQMTLGRSRNSSSPRDRARMMVTEDWEPELPPVSMSMGIKAVRATWAARAFSKLVMMMPVKVADTISSSSQGILCLNRSRTVAWE